MDSRPTQPSGWPQRPEPGQTKLDRPSSRQLELRLWRRLGAPALLAILLAAWLTGRLNLEQLANSTRTSTDTSLAVDTRIQPQPVAEPAADPILVVPSMTMKDETAGDSLADLTSTDFDVIEHDSGVHPAERALWFRALSALRGMSPESLARDSLGIVSFLQLYLQSDSYVGHVVEIRGEVRRVERRLAAPNPQNIAETWRCWVRPNGATNPVVVDVLNLPVGFPQSRSAELHESIEVTGIFLKRWAYRSESGPRVAPLMVARDLVWNPTQIAGTPPPVAGWLPPTLSVGAVLASGVTWWILRRTAIGKRPLNRTWVWAIAAICGGLCSQGLAQPPATLVVPTMESPSTSATPQEYLRLLDFTPEEWQRLSCSEWNAPGDIRIAHQLLHLLQRIPPRDLAQWTAASSAGLATKDSQLPDHPHFVRLCGTLTQIRPLSPLSAPTDTTGLGRAWECRLQSDSNPAGEPRRCLVLQVPQVWQTRHAEDSKSVDGPVQTTRQTMAVGEIGWRTIGEHVCVEGLLMPSDKSSDPGSDHPVAASRVQWLPVRPSPVWNTTADHCLLASVGFDIGLLESVIPRGPLGPEDREAFYALLAAVGQIDPIQLDSLRARDTPLSTLIGKDPTWRGRFCTLSGTARRAIRIEVDDPDIVQRFGITSYYEVEVFVDPDVQVRIVHPETGEAKSFDRYPVVFCCREWPTNAPVGETIHVPVAITGVCLKQWTYRSRFMDEGWHDSHTGRVQFSPLLLAQEAEVIRPSTAASDFLGRLFGGLLFGTLLLSIVFYVWCRRSESQFQDTLKKDIDMSFLKDLE